MNNHIMICKHRFTYIHSGEYPRVSMQDILGFVLDPHGCLLQWACRGCGAPSSQMEPHGDPYHNAMETAIPDCVRKQNGHKKRIRELCFVYL